MAESYCNYARSIGITSDVNCCIQHIRGVEPQFSALSPAAQSHYIAGAQCGGSITDSMKHAGLAVANSFDSMTLPDPMARARASGQAIEHAGQAAKADIQKATASITAAMSRPIQVETGIADRAISQAASVGHDISDGFDFVHDGASKLVSGFF
jgi:hypothetical protein